MLSERRVKKIRRQRLKEKWTDDDVLDDDGDNDYLDIPQKVRLRLEYQRSK